jgi:hypothetical protein
VLPTVAGESAFAAAGALEVGGIVGMKVVESVSNESTTASVGKIRISGVGGRSSAAVAADEAATAGAGGGKGGAPKSFCAGAGAVARGGDAGGRADDGGSGSCAVVDASVAKPSASCTGTSPSTLNLRVVPRKWSTLVTTRFETSCVWISFVARAVHLSK